MNAPILLSEGMSPNDASRLAAFAQTDAGRRILASEFSSRNEDPTLYRLMNEVASLPLAQQHLMHASPSTRTHLMGLSPASVHIDVGLENMFAMYANRDCIADLVMPVVAVPKKSDKIWSMPVATLQELSNAQLAGSRSRPNDVGAYTVNSDLSYSCRDYGLVDFIDNQTLSNADAPLNPRVISATVVKSFLDLSREVRVAAKAFDSAYYGANTTALSGANRWDTSTSDPIAAILAAKEEVFATPNTFVIGGQVWPKLRTNPKVLQYILSRAGVSNIGAVPAQMQIDLFAALIEVDRVIVGRAKVINAQEPGTTASYVWGKSAALMRIEQNPNPKMTQTWGYTFRMGSKAYRNEVIVDRMPGVMGGEYLKLTHSDDEVPVGQGTTGYLFETVIS